MANTTKTQKRIGYLRALIEHSRTSEAEREAAKRALKRVMDSQEAKVEETTSSGAYDWYGARTYGPKYPSTYLTAAEIAKLVRADIKLAMKAARAEAKPGEVALPDPLVKIPTDVKISVRCENFSGGRSVDVIMRNIPEDWGYEMRDDLDFGYDRKCVSEELKEAAQALKTLLNAYNHDGSDSSVDYFDVNYYGSVMAEGGLMLA